MVSFKITTFISKLRAMTTFGRKRHILELIVLILLTVVSIYSVYSVICSYLFENTTTSTSVQMVDNILPFAKFFTVRYFIDNTLFRETWDLDDTELERLLPENYCNNCSNKEIGRIERMNGDTFFSRRLSENSLTLENMLSIANLNGMVANLDNEFLYRFIIDTAIGHGMTDFLNFFVNITASKTGYANNFFDIPDGAYTPEVISVVDAFIEDPNSEKLIDSTISHIVTPDFARLFIGQNTSALPTALFIDWFNTNTLEISIPLTFLSDDPVRQLNFGLIPYDSERKLPLLMAVYWSFDPYDSLASMPESISRNGAVTNPIVLATLNFQNTGVYLTNESRPESDCRLCANLTKINTCKFKCRLDAIIDSCQCMPFTYRRLYYSDTERRSLPRCSTKRYGACLRSATYKPSHCRNEKVMPCTIHENYVGPIGETSKSHDALVDTQFMNMLRPYAVISKSQKYRAYFQINFLQNAYVLFKELPQNTLMDLMGQIGGNLGLFLSFSFYGLWQLGLFTYLFYKRRKITSTTTNAPAVSSTSGVMNDWLQMAQLNAETGVANNISNQAEKVDAVRLHVKNAKSACEAMESRLQQLEAKSVKKETTKL